MKIVLNGQEIISMGIEDETPPGCRHGGGESSGAVMSWCTNCQLFIWRTLTPDEIKLERLIESRRNNGYDDKGWMFQD